jgi:tetratricopeptide (TPR) repeat protein/DNA-binding XRE family transcriptional regulator
MSEVRARPLESDTPRRNEHALGKTGSGRRGRRRGIEIKPGTVKQARLEAGLSLGQVAGTDISRTAIYFVETGKSKPSMETLMLIAERTGRPVDYFLDRPSTLEARSTAGTSDLERLIASGEMVAALAAGQARLAVERDPELVARLKYLTATAHLRLGQPVPGRRLAASARAYFEQVGDMLMVAECLGSEASGAYLMQDPAALSLAEGALTTLQALNPVPQMTEARLLAVLGSVHATNRNWRAAIEHYERAIEAGDVVQDLRRLSLLYSGLSLAYQAVGQYGPAGNYAQRALTIHETLHDRLSLARSEGNLGLMLVRAGDVSRAGPHLERALDLFEELGVESGKAGVLTTFSELALARDELDEAERYATEALELATRLLENGYVADAHFWLGRVAAARGDDETVDSEFEAGFEALAAASVSADRLADGRLLYADLLEARGDLAGANRQLRLAVGATAMQSSLRARSAAG